MGLVSRSAGINTILSSSASNIMRSHYLVSRFENKHAYSISDVIYVANSDGTNNRVVLNNLILVPINTTLALHLRITILFLARTSDNSGLWTLTLDGSVPQLYHQDIFPRYLDDNSTNVQNGCTIQALLALDYWLESSVSSSGVRSYDIATGATTTHDLNGLDGFSCPVLYVSGTHIFHTGFC